MKAYLLNMHLLVPRSRSSAKVKVKNKGNISKINGGFWGIRVSQTHLVCNKQLITKYGLVIWSLILILPLMTVTLFCRECRAKSACTYVQADLALHSPLPQTV